MTLSTPRNINEARTQANINARAATLWADGYTWELRQASIGGTYYMVKSPEGNFYGVDPQADFRCTCPAYEKFDGCCKHSLAIQKVDEERAFQAAYEADGGDDRYWAEAAGL